MNQKERLLTVAFESENLSYSNLEVDLYNSGVNQILSVCAARGHTIYHFTVQDLFLHEGNAFARASVLALPESWYTDPLDCYTLLSKIDERPVPLGNIDLCFMRGDDVRHPGTPNLDILRELEKHSLLIENIDATLATTDKYEMVTRVPEIPQPATYAAATLDQAMQALKRLPDRDGYFVLKDRFGYGCGHGVHRIEFADPELPEVLKMYISNYESIILQEYCPEVKKGDLVVTFFDGELIGTMCRIAAPGEWKTNFSLGATQIAYNLSSDQEQIARKIRDAFSECRLLSVDLLQSGKALEVNAFPGAKGLLDIYGISLGTIVMDRIERELLGTEIAVSPGPQVIKQEPSARWDDIYHQYNGHDEPVEVLDVFSEERYRLAVKDLIQLRPQSPEFILSIPHSGVLVPVKYKEHFEINSKALLEIDLFSDILFESVGGLQVISRLAPFFVDMNRSREGSDSEKLPNHLTNPPTEYYSIEDELVLQKEYSPGQEEQILKYYDLYHGILSSLIESLKREQGYALLIDAHSMSSVGLGRVYDEGQERDNIVVGTLEGKSAHPDIVEAFVDTLKQNIKPYRLGLTCAENEPYSGGFITRMHSDPGNDVHVIQVEVTMDTYMYEPVDTNESKRYALKQSRLHIAQDFLRKAVLAASDACKMIYSS